jgi:hypothetical protein
MVRVIILCLIVTGCTLEEPTTTLQPINAIVAPPPRAAEAAALSWQLLGEPCQLPAIHWVEDNRLHWDVHSNCEDAIGCYTPDGVIYIVIHERASYSPMTHELVHAMLDCTTGDLDPGHQTTEAFGLVKGIDRILIDKGL